MAEMKSLRLPDIPAWRPGVVFWKPVDGGNEVCVYPTVTGGGQVCLGPLADEFGFNEAWMYEHLHEAVGAAEEWDGESDPPGKWLRATGPDQHEKQQTRRHGEPKVNQEFQIEDGDQVKTFQVWGHLSRREYIVTRILPNGNQLHVKGIELLTARTGVIRVTDVDVKEPQSGGSE